MRKGEDEDTTDARDDDVVSVFVPERLLLVGCGWFVIALIHPFLAWPMNWSLLGSILYEIVAVIVVGVSSAALGPRVVRYLRRGEPDGRRERRERRARLGVLGAHLLGISSLVMLGTTKPAEASDAVTMLELYRWLPYLVGTNILFPLLSLGLAFELSPGERTR